MLPWPPAPGDCRVPGADQSPPGPGLFTPGSSFVANSAQR